MSDQPKTMDRRVVRSREALKQALLALMKQKDFDEISITEIVELANYNRGTFYSHYESKEALLDDIIYALIEELLQSFRAPYENEEYFSIHELPAHSVKIFEHIHEHAELYTLLMKSNAHSHLREKMFDAIRQISKDELEHPTLEGINTELLSVYSNHALLGLIFYWIENGLPYTPAYMQEQLVKLIQWRPTVAKTRKKST
ncbi:TetR/AcrR family transcriptional regulator [Paenibacillus glycanilyticus]|uniref:TetR family transcriptional regulator n=1 Tax=Paenibacillus glycanilyticus TaxID=126569 RepID=A0ABQ6GG96_9BACL|nr:TetR/AcrR family transcriptional regulator [Paenibacillus glycanilyticus]GLX69914.1 TetR family transcriptional regulator [Paenibacillus glycanilyticus]